MYIIGNTVELINVLLTIDFVGSVQATPEGFKNADVCLK